MDGPRVYHLSEVRQGKTNTIRYHVNVESKRGHNRTHLGNKSRFVDPENRPVVDKWDDCQAPLAEIPKTHRITSTDTAKQSTFSFHHTSVVPAGKVKKEETRVGSRKWNDRWSEQSDLVLQCELGGRVRIAKRGEANRVGGLRATTRK